MAKKVKKVTEDEAMTVTDVKIRKVFLEGPMKAIVSVTFDQQLAVHDVKVIYARERYFIVMPSKKNPDGTFRDIVHPINAAFRAELENAVLDVYFKEKDNIEPEDAKHEAPDPEDAAEPSLAGV